MTKQEMLRNLGNVYELYKDRPVHTFEINIASMIRDVISFIKETTIEPKRGKWVDDDNSFNSFYANCSECGYQMDKHEERGYHNYCPYCGARMRSGEE